VDSALTERVLVTHDPIAPTHRDAAHRLRLEPTKLSKSLNGVRRFTVDEVTRIADLGRVDVHWLLDGSGPAPVARPPVAVSGPDVNVDGDKDGDKDGVRRHYLEATWDLIAERGVHAVRVADIARATGTSAAAVHYHFATKQEALAEAMGFAVERAFERQRAELRGEGDALRRFVRLIDSQIPDTEQVRREWSIWLQVWAECALRPELRQAHHHYYARWRQTIESTIERGQEQGVFRPTDAADAAIRFTSLADGLGIQVMAGSPSVTPARMRELLIAFVDAELLAPGTLTPSATRPDKET
jgi:AcrR family transcriptional regulator